MIISQLNRIEAKLDDHLRETHDDFDTVHGRINKVENRVSRIEGIGTVLQLLWAGVLAWFGSQRGGGA